MEKDNAFNRIRDLFLFSKHYNIISYYKEKMDWNENLISQYNIVDYKIYDINYESAKKLISDHSTIKEVTEYIYGYKKYQCLIVVNQTDKYCTMCNSIKPIEHFQNETNKYLIEMSDLKYYIFTVCDECEYMLIFPIRNFYLRTFYKKSIRILDIESIQNKIVQIYIHAKIKSYLFLYFILKCKFKKDLTSYIFDFIEPPIYILYLTTDHC